jgi:hypothetical protein
MFIDEFSYLPLLNMPGMLSIVGERFLINLTQRNNNLFLNALPSNGIKTI